MKKSGFIAITITVLTLFVLLTGCNARRVVSIDELQSLGERYLLSLDYEQAVVQFLKLIEIDSMNPRGYSGLAQAYAALDETEKAMAALRMGFDNLPDNSDLLDQSIAVYESIIDKEPDNTDAYLELFKIYIKQKADQSARETLEKGLAKLPHSAELTEAYDDFIGSYPVSPLPVPPPIDAQASTPVITAPDPAPSTATPASDPTSPLPPSSSPPTSPSPPTPPQSPPPTSTAPAAPAPAPPVLDDKNQDYIFDMTAGDNGYSVQLDASGDTPLRWELRSTSMQALASFIHIDSSTGLLTFTQEAAEGRHYFIVVVENDAGSEARECVLIVSARPIYPRFPAESHNYMFSVNYGEEISVQINAVGYPSVVYSLVALRDSGNGGLLPIPGQIDPSTGLLTINASYDAGEYRFQIRAENSAGSITQLCVLTIKPEIPIIR